MGVLAGMVLTAELGRQVIILRCIFQAIILMIPLVKCFLRPTEGVVVAMEATMMAVTVAAAAVLVAQVNLGQILLEEMVAVIAPKVPRKVIL